jgi:hypothetical protein
MARDSSGSVNEHGSVRGWRVSAAPRSARARSLARGAQLCAHRHEHCWAVTRAHAAGAAGARQACAQCGRHTPAATRTALTASTKPQLATGPVAAGGKDSTGIAIRQVAAAWAGTASVRRAAVGA